VDFQGNFKCKKIGRRHHHTEFGKLFTVWRMFLTVWPFYVKVIE